MLLLSLCMFLSTQVGRSEAVWLGGYPVMNRVYGVHFHNLMTASRLHPSLDVHLLMGSVSVPRFEESLARRVLDSDSIGKFLQKPTGLRLSGSDLTLLKASKRAYPFDLFGETGLIKAKRDLEGLKVDEVEICQGLYRKTLKDLASVWLIIVRSNNFHGRAIKIPFSWMFITDSSGHKLSSFEATGLE